MNKQERYKELTVKEMNGTLSDEERVEQVQLYYEIDPAAREFFAQTNPGKKPQDVWGVDTSRYQK